MQQERMSQMMAQIRNFTEQSEFLVRCERIVRSWIREQLWSDPRSQSTLYCSESQDHASLRFWIAAWYKEFYGYFRKRFWTTTCSRRTILYNLQQFKELASSSPDLILQELQRDRRVKWKENRWIRQSFYHTSKVEVECWIILVELILTVVWLIIRDFRFRNCTWWNFLTLWNFKAGKSTSRLKFGPKQHILISHCTGSKKLRWQSQLTNLRHRDRLQGETISPTSICLMRWLRLHWKDFSTSTFTFAKE